MAGKAGPQKMKRKKPTPPVATQFKPGQTGNVNGLGGRPKSLSKEIKKLTHQEFQEVIEAALSKDENQLKAIRDRKGTSALQYGVINCILKAMFVGDWETFTSIVERVAGTTPKKIDITTNGKSITKEEFDLSKFTDEELEMYERLNAKAKGKDANDTPSVH